MDELQKALEYARDQGVSDRQLAGLVKAHVDEVRFRVAGEGVTLTHPGLEAEAVFPESSVEQMQQAGWVLKAEEESEIAEEPAADEAAPIVEVTLPKQDEEQK
jgi:hypothetical protein